jgi:drug/metabolite transporter (DMT)-like permease
MIAKKSYFLFILVCALFGHTFLAISLGLQAGASPLFLAACRFTVAGFLMIMGLLLVKRTTFNDIRLMAGRSLFFSLFMTAGTFGFMFIAQTRVDSGFMARLDSTGPLVTALVASIFLKKRMGLLHGMAFVFGTAGSFLIAAPAASAEPLYLVFAAISVLLYAIANAIYPLLFKEEEDPVLVSALQSFFGGILLLGMALLIEPISLPTAALGPLLYLIVGGSILAHTATLILVRDEGPVFASAWLYVAPVVATLSGYFILGEMVTSVGILGMILALVGVFILSRAENQGRSFEQLKLNVKRGDNHDF